ncbi:MAG: hypothetical protein M0Z30_11025 [Actinomycetota bacterium]|nr:hypothetical protein [Actinomycetota bacterium]
MLFGLVKLQELKGPLAWAPLEHLALAAHPDRQGWAAPLGVREIATGIGVTKDTAARAVTALSAAGLVTFDSPSHTMLESGKAR